MNYIVFSTGEEVVDTYDIVTISEEAFAKMAAEKAGPACNQDSFTKSVDDLDLS